VRDCVSKNLLELQIVALLNEGSTEEVMQLKGIGLKRAQAIMDWREHNSFTQVRVATSSVRDACRIVSPHTRCVPGDGFATHPWYQR